MLNFFKVCSEWFCSIFSQLLKNLQNLRKCSRLQELFTFFFIFSFLGVSNNVPISKIVQKYFLKTCFQLLLFFGGRGSKIVWHFLDQIFTTFQIFFGISKKCSRFQKFFKNILKYTCFHFCRSFNFFVFSNFVRKFKKCLCFHIF